MHPTEKSSGFAAYAELWYGESVTGTVTGDRHFSRALSQSHVLNACRIACP